jgi:hypothetical protein
MEKRYRVEVDKPGCVSCGAGKMYFIIDPDEVASATSYSYLEEAEEICAMLNDALDRGAKKGEYDGR